jgi:hypothetical protein
MQGQTLILYLEAVPVIFMWEDDLMEWARYEEQQEALDTDIYWWKDQSNDYQAGMEDYNVGR